MKTIKEHTCPHSAVFSSFWPKSGMTLVPHPPYSPDLTPRDSFCFPQMEKVLKGKCFPDVEEVKQKMAESVKGIKTDKFKDYFKQWGGSLNRCIASNG